MQPDCTTPPLKTCTTCGREHPATVEYFRARAGPRLHSQCKTCAAAYDAAYQAAHREELAAYKAAYRAAHRDEIAAYYAENRDDKVAYSAAYYAAHRDEKVAYQAAYYAEHRDESLAYRVAYNAEHTTSRAAYERNRRARKRNAPGTHTVADVQAQYARQKGTCFWCHEKVGDTYHVDHVMPVILGGSNGPENLVIACSTCNLSKGPKHPMDFCGRLL